MRQSGSEQRALPPSFEQEKREPYLRSHPDREYHPAKGTSDPRRHHMDSAAQRRPVLTAPELADALRQLAAVCPGISHGPGCGGECEDRLRRTAGVEDEDPIDTEALGRELLEAAARRIESPILLWRDSEIGGLASAGRLLEATGKPVLMCVGEEVIEGIGTDALRGLGWRGPHDHSFDDSARTRLEDLAVAALSNANSFDAWPPFRPDYAVGRYEIVIDLHSHEDLPRRALSPSDVAAAVLQAVVVDRWGGDGWVHLKTPAGTIRHMDHGRPEPDEQPAPLEPGVLWEHPLGGLKLRADDKGGLWFDTEFVGSRWVAEGAAERLIDVFSRWLPTQPKWDAPDAAAMCDHCGQFVFLEDGKLEAHPVVGSQNRACPGSGQVPMVTRPERVE